MMKQYALKNRYLRYLNSGFLFIGVALMSLSVSNINAARHRVLLMNQAVYYDGYQVETIIDGEKEDGILRLSNSLYSVKINPEDFVAAGTSMTLKVGLQAKCDNYDRMGDIRLAFVPKGAEEYSEEEVSRVELARFITPFMNKNRKPDVVSYEWKLPQLAYILRDSKLLEKYDLWLEAYLFGVPYAANEQVKGCEGRNDVFGLSVAIDYYDDVDGTVASSDGHHLIVPIYTTVSEIKGNVNFNNYNPAACDEVGKTERTFTFTTPEDLSDANINLILTNHGANENGEEYVRRLHNVYVDGELLLTYMPGGVSCEPYRSYNTQGNYIYNSTPQPDSYWEEWNNWCPGQPVPVRQIPLGSLSAGEHKVLISVPDAEFSGQDGDFRPSLYLQGLTEGTLPHSGIRPTEDYDFDDVRIERVGEEIVISGAPVCELRLYDGAGRLLEGYYNPASPLSLRDREAGIYIVAAFSADGRYTVSKIMK